MTFFKAGKSASGMTNLAMQMSLVFWPQASRQSQEFTERLGVEMMLEQFSQTYKVPTGHLPPTKRFRPADPQSFSHAA